jgi:hypothetical protein
VRSLKNGHGSVIDIHVLLLDLVPGEDGSLWAEYGLHMTALLQGAGMSSG